MRVAVTTTALLMTSITCLAQTVPEAPTTLRVAAEVVAVSAVVKAKDERAITSLTKDDFMLEQDGKEQPNATSPEVTICPRILC